MPKNTIEGCKHLGSEGQCQLRRVGEILKYWETGGGYVSLRELTGQTLNVTYTRGPDGVPPEVYCTGQFSLCGFREKPEEFVPGVINIS